jgi:hypothetical protein
MRRTMMYLDNCFLTARDKNSELYLFHIYKLCKKENALDVIRNRRQIISMLE